MIQNRRTVVLGLLAIIVATGGFYIVRQNQQNQKVFLFGGHPFSELDLNRMQIAFGKAGLNEFAIDHGRMSVPKVKRDEYLKALDQHCAIPSEFAGQKKTSAMVNLLPREVRIRQQNAEKKLRLERLIAKMKFVEQAWVEYDELKTDGIKPKISRSVVVAIKSHHNRFLTRSQVNTIRRLVTGAIAGLSEEDVVISDVNANISISGNREVAIGSTESQQLILNEITNTIRQNLARFGELLVEVIQEPQANLNKSTPERPALKAGANSRISLNRSSTASKTTNQRLSSIRILITVKNSALKSWMQPRGDVTNQVNIAKAFEEMKHQITGVTQPLMATRYPQYQSLVVVAPDEKILQNRGAATKRSDEFNTAELTQWVKQNWLTLSVILGGVMLVLLLSRRTEPKTKQRESSNTVAPTPVPLAPQARERNTNDRHGIAPDPEYSREVSHDRQLQQQVVDLIKQNPEHATEILKDWIKDAA